MRLQASWAAGDVVVWAAGPNTMPASRDDLADRLEAIGGPSLGGVEHPGVTLPTGARAEARSIPVAEALGWLAAVGGGLGGDDVGASVTWLGRVVLTAVRLVARGSVVPVLKGERLAGGRSLDLAVRWVPALVDDADRHRAGRGHARARSPRCTGATRARSPWTCSARSSTPSSPTPPAASSCPPRRR